MTFALIVSTQKPGAANGVTTDDVDTTGANLIVGNAAWYSGISANGTWSDSKGNSWTPLTKQAATGVSGQMFRCESPTVGLGHNFSFSGNQIYPSAQVSAWSGAAASAAFDVENGATGAAVSTLATGIALPNENNELVIAGLAHENNASGVVSIGGGFTITDTSPYGAGVSEGGSMAYLVQTAATSANPVWDIAVPATGVAATIASFKAAAAAAFIAPDALVINQQAIQRAATY